MSSFYAGSFEPSSAVDGSVNGYMYSSYSCTRPMTPPDSAAIPVTWGDAGHTTSGSSAYSNDSSPASVVTGTTTPSRSPARQHAPALLPKIRPQDIVVEPASAGGPHRHRRVLSNTRNPPGFVPYPSNRPPIQRVSFIDSPTADCAVSPASTTPTVTAGRASLVGSPVTLTPSHRRKVSGGHSRSGSASSIDEATLSRYGYPTYRQLPKYVSQLQVTPTTPATPSILVNQSYSQPLVSSSAPSLDGIAQLQPMYNTATALAPQANYIGSVLDMSIASLPGVIPTVERPASTTLLTYLTGPTQAINLVHNSGVIPTRGLQSYFWWDIRNLRSWSSFSLETINTINGLTKLLTTEIPEHLAPPAIVPPSRLSPESETALVDLLRDVYAPRVNAALAVSQGPDHLSLYAAPDANSAASRTGSPHFLANYASDTERTASGSPRGRVVGVVKSFDRWNTGMRNEAPHRRVEYLNGLSHLQRCMREHSCRYGFIMTEIELVCVRAGCDEGDDVPYFGFLELATPIATKTSSDSFDRISRDVPGYYPPFHSPATTDSSCSASPPDRFTDGQPDYLNVPMTASLALYFLLMLSKSVPLPDQPSGHLNVGGPGALTRQRVLPEGRDKWIPEPQLSERRDAKRSRGWVWPQDAWHRREGGSSRSKVGAAEGKTKKWHK
ncbi:hypothetical protein Plec18167_008280 [Paecilomyces lecythidis]|uniref:Sialidase n=1 Tax=Paecilomyces lecythidis TaxID=3004212 RepID=A0ABR3WY04_9EURO